MGSFPFRTAENSESPEQELLARARAGEVQATHTLVVDVGRSVYWAVRSVLGRDHPDTEDVVQQSLIAFVQSLPRFRNECHFKTYAVRIAVRAALAARKQCISRVERSEAFDSEPPSAHSPQDQIVAARRRTLVRSLLDELPAEQAEALALHVVLELPLKEIAEATGAPLNTVKSRLRLAKTALREKIRADEQLAEELGVAQ